MSEIKSDPERLGFGSRLAIKVAQRVWRVQRGVTLGVQGLVLDDRGRVLLVRHGYRPGWHFPGGGVERGESIALALRRELQEEAGIVLAREPMFHAHYTNFEKFPGDHIALFVVREYSQPVVPAANLEIREQRFFAADACPPDLAAGARRCLAEVLHAAPRRDAW